LSVESGAGEAQQGSGSVEESTAWSGCRKTGQSSRKGVLI